MAGAGASSSLPSIQMFLIGLARLQLIQQMLCIHSGCHKRGPIVDHHGKSIFAALIDGSNLIKVHDSTAGGWTGHRGPPTGKQFGDRPLRQPALKDPSFLQGSLSDCNSQHGLFPVVAPLVFPSGEILRSQIMSWPGLRGLAFKQLCNRHAFFGVKRGAGLKQARLGGFNSCCVKALSSTHDRVLIRWQRASVLAP